MSTYRWSLGIICTSSEGRCCMIRRLIQTHEVEAALGRPMSEPSCSNYSPPPPAPPLAFGVLGAMKDLQFRFTDSNQGSGSDSFKLKPKSRGKINPFLFRTLISTTTDSTALGGLLAAGHLFDLNSVIPRVFATLILPLPLRHDFPNPYY